MNDFWAGELQNRKKSRIIKLIITGFIALLIMTLIILILVYYNNIDFRTWCDENLIKKEVLEEDVKKIEISKNDNVQVYAYDKYICILQKKKIEFYNRVGTMVGEIDIDIVNAEFASAGRYLAICEKNGQKFYLISGKEKLFEKEIEGNISEITVSRNGYISVRFSNSSYKSIIEVFNKNGEEIFRTNLVTARVVKTSISQDSKYLAIAEVDITGIIIKSSIQIVSIELAQTNPEEAMIYKYEAPTNKLIMNIKYQENQRLLCMYNDSIDLLYNQENSELVKFENKKLSFATVALNNRIIFLEENTIEKYKTKTTVNIINPVNNKKRQYITENIAQRVITASNKIAINFGTELHIIDNNGILIKKYKSDVEINNVVMTDNLVAIIYSDRIAIVNF